MTRKLACLASTAAALAALFAPVVARPAPAGDPSLQRLTITPFPGTTFKIIGEYDNSRETCEANKRKPLRARYAGRLEIVRTGDGRLALINDLTFREYLEGLAEVPRSWPHEALKAQVIAARSYALYHYERSRANSLGYDICSTDACQVYRGVGVSEGAFGDAWKRAVAETAGEVLLYRGDPIQAFYFSTSWGRTVSNEEGFGGSPLPYLKPATGEDDDAPLARWHVEIPLGDLTAVLAKTGDWSGPAITSASVSGSSLVLRGGGASKRISLTTFRLSMNRQADCLFPSRYPPKTATRTLPQTILSPHFSVTLSGPKLIVDGRGWGHGVGMAQYGARSLAERGRTAEQILAHFYGGLRPSRYAEPRGGLRVLLTEDAVSIRVEADGAFTARGPGGDLGLGSKFQALGGRRLDVRRSGSIAPVLSVDPLGPAMQRVLTGGTATVTYDLPTAAKVTPILLRDGAEVKHGIETSQTSGAQSIALELTDAAGQALGAGLYEMTIEASDGVDRVRAQAVVVAVQDPAPPPTAGAPVADAGSSLALKIAGAAILLSTLVAGAFALRIQARRRRARRIQQAGEGS